MSSPFKGGPTYSGWMTKKGGTRFATKWQKRHFRLKDFVVKYYKEDKEGIAEQGGFCIEDAKIDFVPKAKYKKEFVLELFFPSQNRKVYVIQAKDKESMVTWIENIRTAVSEYDALKNKSNGGDMSDGDPTSSVVAPTNLNSNSSFSETMNPNQTGHSQSGYSDMDSDDEGPGSLPSVDAEIMASPSTSRMSIMSPSRLGQGGLAELSKFGLDETKKEEDEEDDDILEDLPDIANQNMWIRYKRVELPNENDREEETKEEEEGAENAEGSDDEDNIPPPEMPDVPEIPESKDPESDDSSDEELVPPPQLPTPPQNDNSDDDSDFDEKLPPLPNAPDFDDDDAEEEIEEDPDSVPTYVYFNPVTNQVLKSDPEKMTEEQKMKALSLQGPGRDCQYINGEKVVEKSTRIAILLRDIINNCESIQDLNAGGPLLPADMKSFDDIIATVTRIKDDLVNSTAIVEEEDNRTDTEALLRLNNHPWDFNNSIVDDFRAKAVAEHANSDIKFDNWEAPEYFSDVALPPMFVSGQIVVSVSYMVAGKREPLNVKIHITKDTSSGAAIELAVAKFSELDNEIQLEHEQCVFKVVGAEAYLSGTSKILNYEDIRRELRQQRSVEVELLPRPSKVEVKVANAEEYIAKVPENLPVINLDEYKQIGTDMFTIGKLPMSSLTTPYRCRIVGIDNCNGFSLPRMGVNIGHVYLETFLFIGNKKLDSTISCTTPRPVSESPRWMKWFTSDINYSKLPAYTRIGFLLFGKKIEVDKDILLGWGVRDLVDHNGVLSSGAMNINLWSEPAKTKDKHGGKKKKDPEFIFKATTRDNHASKNPCVLHVEFEQFVLPVVAPLMEDHVDPSPMKVGVEVPLKSLKSKQNSLFKKVCDSDALYQMSEEEKELVWMTRHHLVDKPHMLCKFLLAVDWCNIDYAREARRLLKIWTFDPKVPAVHAIQFLDFKYPDTFVRAWAVEKLSNLPDHTLHDYILQLVQCLKYEPYHDSALKRFLITRALKNPLNIGHLFFWLLKAELHILFFAERFGLILEEYLAYAGRHSILLRVQDSACNRLVKISEKIIKLTRAGTDEIAIKEAYKQDLEHLNRSFFLPAGGMYIPSDPRKKVMTLDVNKCRYMSSKMVPLWLVFHNSDPQGKPVYLMFKSGDDLRQDMLTLQLLNIMDQMWLGEGLDMRLKPYEVIATGVNDHLEGVGMIQPVINSDTISGIQLKHGGGAMGALKMDPIDLFIREHNAGKQKFEKAVDNFTRSSAGYLVATYILGIGDRHNGNIMVTKEGHLFHIDFGHFLGNFKSKFGVKRERAAFVFTPEMAYVMGGHDSKLFKSFLGLCSSGYACLRTNANFFEVLFALMVPAGMPELLIEADVNYFREKMALNTPLKTADKAMRDEVKKSLASRYRRFDNMIHNFKHG